jgi:hypothetical protein
MGGADEWPRLSGSSRASCCVGKRNHQHQVLPPRSAPDKRRWKNSQNGVPEACLPKWPLHGRHVLKDRYAAYLIMARRHISTKQAGYIDADFLHPPTFPLQSDGGPYIEQVRRVGPAGLVNLFKTRHCGQFEDYFRVTGHPEGLHTELPVRAVEKGPVGEKT